MSEKVKVTRIGLGLHSIVKVYCADYNGNIVYQNAYLIIASTTENLENEIIQEILDDLKDIKEKFPVKFDTVTMYTEDDYGERHVFFDMDDCETVLFGKEEG